MSTGGATVSAPALRFVLATGAYLASDLDVWGEGWVLISAGILVLVAFLGGAVLGPGEEQLSRHAAEENHSAYHVLFRRGKLVTWLLAALVAVATFLMVARVPGGGGGAGTARDVSAVREAGCLSCHRVGSEGSERPGGDLSRVGAELKPSSGGRSRAAATPSATALRHV